jgi:hypothetical protein
MSIWLSVVATAISFTNRNPFASLMLSCQFQRNVD